MDAFLYESQAYLGFIGMLQLCGGVILIPFFVPVASRLNLSSFTEILAIWGLFNVLLLIFGCLGNYAFHIIGNGKLYVHVDHVVDFVPFIPFGELWIFHKHADAQGHLLGNTSIWQIRALWVAIAVPVWLLTWYSTYFLCRLRIPFRVRSRVSVSG